ncbi:MAG: type II toxin-antitoxin system HicA family toxin [Gaiellaceae bacterium]
MRTEWNDSFRVVCDHHRAILPRVASLGAHGISGGSPSPKTPSSLGTRCALRSRGPPAAVWHCAAERSHGAATELLRALRHGGRVPRLLDQKTARRLLERHGWNRTTGGKHVIKMERAGERPITLPHHRGQTYSRGLTRAILKQAGLD